MTLLDLRILGATLVTPEGRAQVDVGVAGGKIVAHYLPGGAPEAAETIQADGLLLLPGIVDAHFHCRAPGHPEREDFASGTRAAAAGGVTTICEMPIAWPGVHSGEVLRQRRELAEANAHVDFGLWGGGGADRAGIETMAVEGAIGYKIFLHAPPHGREYEFQGLSVTDNRALYRAFQWIAPTGLPCAIHCEDDDLIEERVHQLREAGRVDVEAHQESRPDFVEAVAVSKVLLMAEALGLNLHLPHVSTGRSVELVRQARARGQRVSLETCPHYLLANSDDVARVGPYAKINPPIRPEPDRAALSQALVDGTVDNVGSDHAPYTAEEKARGATVIFDGPSGSPGVETMGPGLVDRALNGEIALERVVEVLSAGPARIIGLYPRKGSAAPGADADFVLVDPNGSWTVDRAKLFTKSREAARLFDSRVFKGRFARTIVRGRTVYLDGQIAVEPGYGVFVRPP